MPDLVKKTTLAPDGSVKFDKITIPDNSIKRNYIDRLNTQKVRAHATAALLLGKVSL